MNRYQKFATILAITLGLFHAPLLADNHTKVAAQKPSNQLADHPSPYLALHGSDPVKWQDWSEEVLQRAKRENKLILISSGYFSCHWCHVMQAESYKNETVAEIMNRAFIPVKVDRELEPALDKRLMNFAQNSLGRGGWPLNVFMSPDGLPVFATLYQPQVPFLELLLRLEQVWKQQHTRIRQLAQLENPLKEFKDAQPELDMAYANELFAHSVTDILSRGDEFEGGFGQSNKFPSTPQLTLLVESLSPSHGLGQQVIAQVEEFLTVTLDAMANNGLQDHLAGGFFRYVVDPSWEIPHFEKMLYDNANLAQLYLHAGDVLNNSNYIAIARRTLDFMSRDMASPSGALYASFSAVDDKDIEGGYYLWQNEQLKQILNQQEYRVFSTTWNTTRPNDLEIGNHLRTKLPAKEVSQQLHLDESYIKALLRSAQTKLLKSRKQRILPTDDKLIASWNAQALSAFAQAAQAFNEPRYRQQAKAINTFLINHMWKDTHLNRSLSKGRLIGTAAIDDYAYVAKGFLDWALLNPNPQNFERVETVLEQAWQRFHHKNAWSYADASLLPPQDGEEIMSEETSASPSATIIQTTISLYNLGKLSNIKLYQQALSALNRGESTLRANAFWYASQILAMQHAH